MMIISIKDNISFIYITMETLRKEIEQEMMRVRIDKGRLFDLLLKIVDNCGAGGSGSAGPAGPAGPPGPAGPRGVQGVAGPACECKCVAKEVAEPEATPTPAKKTVSSTKKAPVKKKVVSV
jgi:hypothetical protein